MHHLSRAFGFFGACSSVPLATGFMFRTVSVSVRYTRNSSVGFPGAFDPFPFLSPPPKLSLIEVSHSDPPTVMRLVEPPSAPRLHLLILSLAPSTYLIHPFPLSPAWSHSRDYRYSSRPSFHPHTNWAVIFTVLVRILGGTHGGGTRSDIHNRRVLIIGLRGEV